MNCRHFGIEDELSTGSFWEIEGRGGGEMRALTRICHLLFALVAAPKEGVFLALSCQAFARLLLADLELVLWSRRVVAS